MVLTEFRKFDEPVQFDSSLSSIREMVLNYDENFFSFEFAALDFTEPSKNRYRYRLEGLEAEWVDAGHRRNARYTNVDPGDYVFRVRASNNDAKWNDEGVAIRVVVRPPFWKTWWFITLSSMFFAGVFGGVVWYVSVRKIKKRLQEMEREQAIQRERERISRDLHDHVGAQLVNIISGLDLVGKYSPPMETRAQRLLRSLQLDARASIMQLRETIWAIKTMSMTLDAFAGQVENYSRKQLEFQDDVEFYFQSKCDARFELTPVQVLNCFRIVQESLTNCIKYAHANNIRVSITSLSTNKLRIVIADDGVGIRDGAAGGMSGNGILNMQKRAEELGGVLAVAPRMEGGTVVTVEVPLIRIVRKE